MSPLSGVISESWQQYKAHARHLLTIAFIIYVITGIISAALREIGGFFGLLLAELITIIAVFLLQAALVKAVQDVRDGRADLSVGQTFSAATPYIGSVAGASILAGIAIAFGFVLLIIPGLALITIWCLIVPVIVLEQTGALASFGRSLQLVRGYFWNVFGTLCIVWVIMIGVGIVLAAIFTFMPHLLGNFLADVISGTLVAPFIALVVTSMYFRLVAAPAGGPVAAGGYNQNPYGSAQPGTFGGPPAGGEYGAGQYGGSPFQAPPPQDTGFPPQPGPQDGGFPPTS
jgi:hypothetical protein